MSSRARVLRNSVSIDRGQCEQGESRASKQSSEHGSQPMHRLRQDDVHTGWQHIPIVRCMSA